MLKTKFSKSGLDAFCHVSAMKTAFEGMIQSHLRGQQCCFTCVVYTSIHIFMNYVFVLIDSICLFLHNFLRRDFSSVHYNFCKHFAAFFKLPQKKYTLTFTRDTDLASLRLSASIRF